MAGSITVTATDLGDGITKYGVAWVSDASGVVSANTFGVKRGEILQVKYIPNGGGTAPTDLYDLTMLDADGFDVLGGTGANLSGTLAALTVPLFGAGAALSFRIFLDPGLLTPTIANAGNAKGGTINLYVGL
jgi:hypothetical protein